MHNTKHTHKLFVAIALVLGVYTSCKKENLNTVEKQSSALSEEAVASKVALNLYQALYGQLSSKTLQTSGDNLLRVMSTNPDCGKATESTTDKTIQSGDTTRVYKGKAIFTLMCDGYFNNGWNVDAYTAYDSLHVTEKGSGFDNNTTGIQKYVVKSLDKHYQYVSVGGTVSFFSHTSKQDKNGVTTAFYDLGTQYKLNDIKTKTGEEAQFVQGVVDFNTSNIYKDATTDIGGSFNYYSGHIRFLNANKAQIYFKTGEDTYTRYDMDLKKGEMGKPVKNVKFN